MMKTKDLTVSAFFVIVIAIGAQITIPLPYVPFSLQIFTLSLSAYILSKKQLILTMSVYLILGFIGIPVFAGYSSGFMKPTIGFIIGFLPYSLLLKKSKILALSSLYLIGLTTLTLYFYLILDLRTPVSTIMITYGLFFIPTDLISIYTASMI